MLRTERCPLKMRLLCVAWLLLPRVAGADVTADEIEQCMRRNAPEQASIPSLSIRTVDRGGESSEALARVYWSSQDDQVRVVLRMAAPDDVRGTSLLMIEGDGHDADVYVYLPELSKVKRLRRRHLDRPLLGTDFSFEDFERIRGTVGNVSVTLTGEQQIHGRPVWVLDGRPDPKEKSAYDRFVIFVDQEYCLPLRTDFIETGDEVRKVLSALPDHITREGGHFVPRRISMRDLRDHTETLIAVNEIHVGASLPPDLFTVGALGAGVP